MRQCGAGRSRTTCGESDDRPVVAVTGSMCDSATWMAMQIYRAWTRRRCGAVRLPLAAPAASAGEERLVRSRCRPGSSWSAGHRGTRAGRRDDLVDLRVRELRAELPEQLLDRAAEHRRRRPGDRVQRFARPHRGSNGWRAGTRASSSRNSTMRVGAMRPWRLRYISNALAERSTAAHWMSSNVVPTSSTVGSRRKYFTSRMRDVLSARSSMPSEPAEVPGLVVGHRRVGDAREQAGWPSSPTRTARAGRSSSRRRAAAAVTIR